MMVGREGEKSMLEKDELREGNRGRYGGGEEGLKEEIWLRKNGVER